MPKITETIFRDAHQSLAATRIETSDMIPILEKIDEVGYWSLEMWGGATFDTCLRFLNENPWQRIREFKKHIKKTKLQMLLRGQNLVGYKHYADDIVEKFIQTAHETGIEVFRIFDALNDIRNMEFSIKVAKKCGAIVQGTVNYTISPVHKLQSFIDVAKQLRDSGSDIICIKDMAGLISPAIAFELISKMKKETGLPVALHSHCTTGMAPISYFKAAEAGVDHLDTALSPFSSGTSQPTTETLVAVLDESGYKTGVDAKHFTDITRYFENLKEKYQYLISPLAERIDVRALIYQVPGGMFTNLVSQLEKQGAMDKFEAVLAEIPKVREDLGWVPLVTPTSQIVGTQATLNVIMGQRYKVIIQEVKDICKGLYGRTPAEINPEVIKLAIGDHARITGRPADTIAPEWQKCKDAVKQYSDKDEDILSYALFPQVAIEFFENQKNPMKKEQAGDATKSSKQTHPEKQFVLNINGEKYEVGIAEVVMEAGAASTGC
ncbi:MAG: pyruvate carboxylase subunit B [Candidatus Wallbacteria bacterium GWC2_49_35]|uniref:Pyruvate carboxylase subunit B n=1 Tax=Candidatus Wallbacteria bacterium GWC2_49_35 TaxID=1817813 RepID=A0A1F7WWN1_9BACT|nr:MAG: pyruvate carboxylase subunit B [Candidatus Wallbacteria bacterium GWC2_49_35]HBC75576.1 pyruvate carboxylase subunit B [Candidatus Wallbacteria bacterium]